MDNSAFQRVLHVLRMPFHGQFFLVVSILNLLSSYVYLRYDRSTFAVLGIFCLSIFLSYLESALACLLRNHLLRNIYTTVIIAFHYLLTLVEFFLLIRFQTVLNQDVIDILSETNPEEASNFIETYLSFNQILLYVLASLAIGLLIVYITRVISKTKFQPFALLFSALGFLLFIFCGFNYIKYRDGMSIPQYTTITRAGYAFHVMKGRMKQIRNLQKVCSELKASQHINRKPTVIVVIGESFSVYHSSLYGYDKKTNPRLSQYKNEGSLVVFDNAVSLYDATHGAMKADFSLDSLGVDFERQALFPACFKAAGYYTKMYDNQYFVSSAVTFLSDKELSETMFDYRNTKHYKYDGMMIDEMEVSDTAALYVIHLWGQHYSYKKRYPESYTFFKAKDYDASHTELQRQAMADYDNATLYNDHVLSQIIDKFKDQYCCLFYFADHGEEVYEIRNYMGHGNAEHSPNLNYQIRVPLMVWLSPSFLADNKQLLANLQKATHYPICTDDIGHTILDVAGISTEDFAATRSFVNSSFIKNRHRIVLNSIDYDREWVNKR